MPSQNKEHINVSANIEIFNTALLQTFINTSNLQYFPSWVCFLVVSSCSFFVNKKSRSFVMMKFYNGRLKAQMSVVFFILGHGYSDHDYD